MPIVKEKGIDVTAGNYTGRLIAPRIEGFPVTKRKGGKEVTEEALYIKCDVKTDGRESILTVSWPASLSPASAFGRFIDRCSALEGFNLEVGESFDEKLLDGLRVAYSVKPDGQFVRVDEESVRPDPNA